MRGLLKFIIGLGVGATIAMVIVAMFSPVSGEQFRKSLLAHYQNALKAGQDASAKKRAELETELETLRQKRLNGEQE